MGYAIVIGPCFGCGRIFGFNPHRVPSVMHNGERRQICQSCIESANIRRHTYNRLVQLLGMAFGIVPGYMPLWEIYPGAYEHVDESDL